jgi:hypothetical protein
VDWMLERRRRVRGHRGSDWFGPLAGQASGGGSLKG